MAGELELRFSGADRVTVGLIESGRTRQAAEQTFARPLDEAAQKELEWYFEVYPAQYMTEVDDKRGERIAAQLPAWGAALFKAVFAAGDAAKLFYSFQQKKEPGRLLTVSGEHPAVLAQPWELLKDPEGTYLFLDNPRISIRRRLGGAGGGQEPFQPDVKDALHLLFVVSRPSGASFIDPRADPNAAMDALDERAPGRVTVEFLRPATLDALIKRLEDEDKPPVDILHFDGHGAYDVEGRLAASAEQALLSASYGHWRRDAEETAVRQQGFLLFEKEDGTSDLVPAALLGAMLNQQRIGLVVLSACQSAMIGSEDAMGSVAARLVDAGLPAVLAMTHSVLVQTTRALFDEFYDQLAGGRPIGTSLDNARRALYAHPERGERRRGNGLITLKLQDWCLPALYQAGQDSALLTKGATPPAAPAAPTDSGLPELQESGFWGRRRSLWDIERWFVGGTRRLVVHGFGGEGKTYLAAEAGRWLTRTGLFARVCFVDYKSFQGVDARGYAVSTLSAALGHSLIDAAAATAALQATPTLLILDNLEALYPNPEEPPPEAARELLDAACAWSEAGASRVLVTTRQPDLHDPDWPTRGSNRCRYRELGGLQPDDALAWFQALMALPPEPSVPPPARAALVTLFEEVDFHPLSIGVLAEVLKIRRIAEVGERLAAILKEEEDPLVASLNLSIERLDPALRASLPRLGVFQGGALEPMVTQITELSAEQWAALRLGLEQTGLIRAEALLGITSPYLRFHPTLAPMLWARLGADERQALTARHREAYYHLSGFLYVQDSKAVGAVRALTRAELPNLMAAVHAALDAAAPEAAGFADNVGRFLRVFGLARDQTRLVARAQAAAGEKGSQAWYLVKSQIADQLSGAGRFAEAEQVFADVLATLGDTPSHRLCITLLGLARCRESQGQAADQEALLRRALAEAGALEKTPDVQNLTGVLQADLGDALLRRGDLDGARAAHKTSLATSRELGDDREVAVSLGQLGSVALAAGDLAEAEARYREALTTFQDLGEPALIATSWHQLGIVYQEQRRWGEAERAYRESARLKEERGDLRDAATSWQQLAIVMQLQDKPDEAERWYLKALAAFRTAGDRSHEASTLNNLANLKNRLSRLADARAHAEQALAIKRTLDPAAHEIWKTYNLLAEIAAAEGRAEEARAYRQQQRDSFATAPASQEKLRQHAALIAAVAGAAADSSRRPPLDAHLEGMIGRGWGQLVAALRRLLAGERDEDALCAGLDREDSWIVTTVLRALADPAVLAELQSPRSDGEIEDTAHPGTPEEDTTSAPSGARPMTEVYKTYLEQEGFHPKQEGELLWFKEEGRSYVIVANEDDPEFFRLVFPGFWSIDSDDERARAYQAANHATAATKVAKIYVQEDGKSVWASIEMFFESPEQLKSVFTRSMHALKTGVNNFAEKMK